MLHMNLDVDEFYMKSAQNGVTDFNYFYYKTLIDS